MKSQFLKIAGVKSEKAFYKKFPTEAAFFKAHPEAKKMANGGEQDKGQLKKLDDLTNFTNYNDLPKAFGGLELPDPFSFGKGLGKLNTTSPTSLGRLAGSNPTADLIGGLRGAQRDPSGLGKLFGEYTTKGTIGGAAAKGAKGSASGYLDAGKNILGGISALKQEKQVRKQAKQDAKLTGVMKDAALLPQEIIEREYVRPEDTIIQPGQLAPAYGTGTNILAAQYGARIGGNPTEIQNTFAPDTIYTDMGYEPLNDTSRLKAYYHGGKMSKAAGGGMFDPTSGFGKFMTGQGGDVLGNIAERVGTGGRGPSGSSQLGKGIGQAAGTLVGGPVGSLIGGTLGSLVGGLFGKKGAKETEMYQQQAGQNISDIQYANIGVGLPGRLGYGSFMEDGGYVSNDWTPQVITTFGEHKLKDLLQPPHDADMLRAGGHLKSYTPPSAQAMYTGREQFAMGGDLKVHRGEAETISYNPYLPDGGETIMFRGPSHDNGGMPIEYGSSPVEVEGGEPAVKLRDGGDGETNLNVYGNLKISKLNAELLNNPKFADKKFKNVANDLSKGEAKSNKNIDKASNRIDNLDVITSFDKLSLDTNNAILQGENMKLKKYAQDKMDLAALQSAINDTAEENGLIADDLAKGKIMMDKSKGKTAKSGIALKKAQTGVNQQGSTFTYNGRTLDPSNPEDAIIIQQFRADAARNEKDIADFKNKQPGALQEVTINATPWPTFEEYLDMIGEDVYPGNEGQQYKEYQQYVASKWGNVNNTPVPQYEETQITPLSGGASNKSIGKEKKKFNLNKTLDTLTPYLNEALPYLRGTNARPLPLGQITPELSVMGDREEPVYAQTLQPNLAVPFDIIDPQAQLNDARAQAKAAMRAVGSDPSGQAAIMSQLYDIENKIRGGAAQTNLANKLGIYNQNLQTLNDTQLANLNIRDKQYVRQAQAKSNTKAQKLLAAKSISDKFAENRKTNRNLGVYENLYNYRFDEQGRAQNRNPLVDFDQMIAGATPEELKAYAALKEEQAKKAAKAAKGNSRNGSIVKAIKNL
jgi:hypothetical protein